MPAALDYSALAVELVRALRGRRSRAAFIRRMSYRSNVAHSWETGRSWPTAAVYLQLHRRVHGEADVFARFFQRAPDWLGLYPPDSPEALAALLRQLRGKAPISALAERSGFSRFQISRWLSGATQPPMPAFLCLVEASSRRLLDFVVLLANPSLLHSITRRWQQLELARKAAYDLPWSHAVLRALELVRQPPSIAQVSRLAERLGVPSDIEESLSMLVATGQVVKRRGRYLPVNVTAVSTAQAPERRRQLEAEWVRTALDRLERGAPGTFGYSLFAVSQVDLRRLRGLHAEYVRAMQEIIARSAPNECVGLFFVQLLDLAATDNALASID